MVEIMIVDDDENVREALRRGLSKAGHTVHLASCGDEAMRILQQCCVDLVITDIIMPGQDGFEMILALRARHPTAKVMAMSGGGFIDSCDYLKMARTMGAVATFSKPLHMRDVLEAIDQLFATAAG